MSQSVESLLGELGIEYTVTEDEAWARCPFHSPDTHPSWSVHIKSGVHNCFSCSAKGNLAHLVSSVRKLPYTEAVIYVNETVGWAKSQKWREDYETKNYALPEYKISEADLAVFVSPPDVALESRKLTAESADRFGVKWNDSRNSWIFPIREPWSHKLWGWQEKNERIFRNYPAGTRKSKTLFGLPAFRDGSPVILVESPADAVYLDACGFGGGLSSWGVQVSSFQLSVIQSLTEHLILALDNDKPGISETARLAGEFTGCNHVSVFNYGMSTAKDPGEMTSDEVKQGIENAIPAMRYKRSK